MTLGWRAWKRKPLDLGGGGGEPCGKVFREKRGKGLDGVRGAPPRQTKGAFILERHRAGDLSEVVSRRRKGKKGGEGKEK